MKGTFWNYTISDGEKWETAYAVVGEYHLHGARGAHYVTFRRKRNGVCVGGFEFMNFKSGTFVRIAGNSIIATEYFEKDLVK